MLCKNASKNDKNTHKSDKLLLYMLRKEIKVSWCGFPESKPKIWEMPGSKNKGGKKSTGRKKYNIEIS
jgi:hypothetical protein